jgi:hypothetical protein
MDAQVAGDVRDRTVRLEVEADRALAQLIGLLPRSHDRWSISFPQDRTWRRSLQEIQGPSNSFRVFLRFLRPSDLRPVATGCNHGAP